MLVFLGASLAVQAGLGSVWPTVHGYLDLMSLPVILASLRSQRAGMLTGCAAGLMQDAWFQIGSFGLNGFKKTLLGWTLGGVASRFELNHFVGRVAVGFSFSLLDSALGLGLHSMLDRETPGSGVGVTLLRALCLGAATALVFGWMDQYHRYRELRRLS